MGGVGRIIGIVVVVVLIAAGIVFFVLPNKATRTETLNIERPAQTVFARLASTPPGTAIAEGVTLSEVTSAANNVVEGNVTYADGATGHVEYTVAPNGAGSRVQLKLDRDLGPNPLNRIGAITGGPVAPAATAAAAAVTADLNSLPNADFAGLVYDVEQVTARPFFYIQNCSSAEPDSVTSIVNQAAEVIPPLMHSNNLQQAGPLMAVEPRVVQGQYCFQIGYPYTGRAPQRSLLTGAAGQTPGGTVLHVHYTGAEADVLAQVYNKLDALLGAAHLDNPATTDDDWTTYEVYNDDPTQPGGSRNRDIYYVAQGDITAATHLLPPSAAAEQPAAPASTTPAPAGDSTTPAPASTTPAPATTP